VGIWSDHKSVEACFQLQGRIKIRKRARRRKLEWKDVDKNFFVTKTEELLRDSELSHCLQTRCEQIEKTLVETSMMCFGGDGLQREEMDATIKDLMERRKALPANDAERREVSKQIQREIRRVRRVKQHQKIAETLERFENLKRIPSIKTVRKRTLIVKMVNKDGKAESDRMSIANISADFCEQLYASRHESHIDAPHDDDSQNIDPFTRDELVKTIKDLNSNRCADSKGVKAEMLKYGGPKLVDVLLEMFNKVLMEKNEPHIPV
jgi:hypothetical protein